MQRFLTLESTLKKFQIHGERYATQSFFGTSQADLLDYVRSLSHGKVHIFSGDCLKTVEGEDFKEYFKGAFVSFPHSWVSLPQLLGCPGEAIHANMAGVERVLEYLKAQPEAEPVLVVGSGSTVDTVKHAIFKEQKSRELHVIPSAITVTAYTSHFAVLEESGAKRTQLSQPVSTCFWFAPLLQGAPMPLTQAGYGDLLARFVAYGDWYLAECLGLAENYNDLAWSLMTPYAQTLCDIAPSFAAEVCAVESLRKTSEILAMAGIAMSAAAETTPLSGFEHTISHSLDYLRLSSGRKLVMHGEQVALGSLLSARCFDWLKEQKTLPRYEELRIFSEEKIAEHIDAFLLRAPYFGAEELDPIQQKRMQPHQKEVKPIFERDYLKKHRQFLANKQKYEDLRDSWESSRKKLEQYTLGAEVMERLVQESGLPCFPEETKPTTSHLELRWGLRFTPFLRSRFCLADLLLWLGEDPVHVAAL